MYDYLIVGAGLFGSTFARRAYEAGKDCLVIDKRNHIAGNAYTYYEDDICVHKYGAHIFRTDNRRVWDFVNRFAEFNRFTNCPIANYRGELYNLPFNMNTFYQLYGATTPDEAKEWINKDRILFENPKNLEEYCLSTVGRKIYEKLIKEYTEKQWGMPCTMISPDVMTLPLRFTFDNNYFNEKYQGVPIGGYTAMVEKMLNGSEVILGREFKKGSFFNSIARKIVYTGKVDELYNYCEGMLEYRGLFWKTRKYNIDNYQGNAVVNYTSDEQSFTRIIEHKHFENNQSKKTIVSEEYPAPYVGSIEPFYPINTQRNQSLYERYKIKHWVTDRGKIILGGWCGSYSNDTMDKTIENALALADSEFGGMYE